MLNWSFLTNYEQYLWGSIGVIILSLSVFLYARITGYRKWEKNYRKRSHSVVKGLVNEQIAPLIDGFPGTPSDARFLGKPIDYIIFQGLSTGEVEEIIFVEVKTHSSGQLTHSERSVRDAIRDKRVRWVKYSLDSSE